MIKGIVFEALATHAHDRGLCREVIRSMAPSFAKGFDQMSDAPAFPETVNA